jgi:hypothetical protein
VPLTKIQAEILRLLAVHRDPESYVAGATPLNRDAIRFSSDIDVFLHPVDLAINKVMAAAGRRAVRDLVDLITAHRTILPLGALVWAAVEKSPGFTPEGLIAEIRRNAHYPAAEWRSLETTEPLDPGKIMEELRAILNEAQAFVAAMPSAKAGLLFLQDGAVVQPDPERLHQYATHTGQKRGHWPTSPEIAIAMFERYSKN